MDLATRRFLDWLTYTVDVSRAVRPEGVTRVARMIIAQRQFRTPPDVTIAAIDDALADPDSIARAGEDELHLRACLTELRAQLDAARPWPEPSFRPLPVEENAELMDAPVLLQVTDSKQTVTGRLNQGFRRAGDDLVAVVLSLTGGPTIALTAPARAGRFPIDVRASATDAATLRQALHDATGLDAEPV